MHLIAIINIEMFIILYNKLRWDVNVTYIYKIRNYFFIVRCFKIKPKIDYN